MAVKVIIKRKYPKQREIEKELFDCIRKIRNLVLMQSGYISGEYLKVIDGEDEMEQIVTISSWFSLEDWQTWFESEERQEIQVKMDAIAGVKSEHAVYRYIKTR